MAGEMEPKGGLPKRCPAQGTGESGDYKEDVISGGPAEKGGPPRVEKEE